MALCVTPFHAQMCAVLSVMQPSVSKMIQHIHQRNEEKDELLLLILSASLSGKVQTMLECPSAGPPANHMWAWEPCYVTGQ